MLWVVAANGNPNYRQGFEFESAGNTEGWTANNASISAASGLLAGSVTAEDPQVIKSGFFFPGSASSGLLVRMRSSVNGRVQLFWGRVGADHYSSAMFADVDYSGHGEFQTLFFSCTGHGEWDEQTITRLRIDPPGGAGAVFDIDWIRVLSWDYDNDGWRDGVEGNGDDDGDGLINLEDPDRNNDGTSDAWMRSIDNPPGCMHFDFETPGDLEGWTTARLELHSHANGVVTASVNGLDSKFVRTAVYLQSGLFDGVLIGISFLGNPPKIDLKTHLTRGERSSSPPLGQYSGQQGHARWPRWACGGKDDKSSPFITRSAQSGYAAKSGSFAYGSLRNRARHLA